ncbi:MAG: AMMECR1 domain-containing protein [Bacteroidota bacterium]
MFEPNSVYAKIAYDAILLYIKAKTKLNKQESEIPQALKLQLGCKVSIMDSDGNSVGSAGTPEAKKKYLFHEIVENAVKAAESLSDQDLNNITVNVDVFSQPKEVQNTELLKPHKHGLIIQNQGDKRAIVYPNTEEIDNPEKMIQAAKEKLDIPDKKDSTDYEMKFFTATRYK